jgi:para-nitrobenzyl esterase
MKTKQIISGFLILLVSSTGFAQKNKIAVSSVKIASGMISGTTGQDAKVMAFKGIPYAAPPLADLRWKEPQPVKSWQGVRKCDTFGPIAPQKRTGAFPPYTTEMMIPAEGTISEDCLYLNVWTTAKSTNDKRPVIVFIHGGSFGGGSGSISIYDGESMAANGVVFVTIN